MAKVLEINNAIVAHGLWKIRLKMTISSGQTEFPVETIRDTHACAFGQWLASEALSTADKAGNDYLTVRELHAQFHDLAGLVAKLAVNGNKTEAEALLLGEFETASVKLTGAMTDWKRKLI